jgi:single stranded DNA-binding protein
VILLTKQVYELTLSHYTVRVVVKPYTRFALAVDQGKDQKPMWLNITTWDKLAETVEMYAHKGMQVFIQGEMTMRAYKDKNGVDRQSVDIVANTMQTVGKETGQECGGIGSRDRC